jgi:hypothetical protein
MDIGASLGELRSKVSYSLRQDKQAVYLPVVCESGYPMIAAQWQNTNTILVIRKV